MMPLDHILNTIQITLEQSVATRKHPFRYCTLATVHNTIPKQRTVVLRKVTPTLALTFYTDIRTSKIQDLTQNPEASVLFYDPLQNIQLTLQGRVEIITTGTDFTTIQQAIPEYAKRAYTSRMAPGTPITAPDAVTYNQDVLYFALLTFVPYTIKYLKIDTPHHSAAIFNRIDEEWKGTFVTP